MPTVSQVKWLNKQLSKLWPFVAEVIYFICVFICTYGLLHSKLYLLLVHFDEAPFLAIERTDRRQVLKLACANNDFKNSINGRHGLEICSWI